MFSSAAISDSKTRAILGVFLFEYSEEYEACVTNPYDCMIFSPQESSSIRMTEIRNDNLTLPIFSL